MSKIFSKIGCAFKGLNKFTIPQIWYNSASPKKLIYDAWIGTLHYARQYKIINAIIPRPSFVERVFLQKNCSRAPSVLVTLCLTILIMIIASFIAYRVYSKKENPIVYKALQRDILDTDMCPEPTDQLSCGAQINLNENILQ